MTAFSTFLANELIDHVLKGTAYTVPATVALALFTTATGDGGTGTEVADSNGYARLEVEGATGRTFSAGASSTTDNDQDWDFAAASGGIFGSGPPTPRARSRRINIETPATAATSRTTSYWPASISSSSRPR